MNQSTIIHSLVDFIEPMAYYLVLFLLPGWSFLINCQETPTICFYFFYEDFCSFVIMEFPENLSGDSTHQIYSFYPIYYYCEEFYFISAYSSVLLTSVLRVQHLFYPFYNTWGKNNRNFKTKHLRFIIKST